MDEKGEYVNMEIKTQEMEVDIKRLFMVLLRRSWIVALVAIFMASMLFGYAYFFVKPTYSSGVKFYVNNTNASAQNNAGTYYSPAQLTAAKYLAETYMVVLQSTPVLRQVQEMTGLNYTQGQLRKMIASGNVNDTEVFQVVVTCENYKHAAQIAQALTAVLPSAISDVVIGSSVRIVENAVENPHPVGPNYVRYIMIGALIGIVLTCGIIIVLDITDATIDNEDYLTGAYEEVPLLAVIPCGDVKKSCYKGYKGYYAADSKSASVAKREVAE